ncbi:MAG: Rieske (2Fe-2S) protein [Melioribacteraceae bacterium]|nr:Rieske (2Fe-2S) protein [Melioribacteraceae bacterium]MCF8353518.1 Rieske (2Fe-2S) protein [Melioribacteraceae bacterium]MCF8392647.1 Rieske (2Fe-2S) protein [Melioribacteraceae bacterium]MCF8418481.1 Rieske (2Fe-2S) protein [Melioribacteraceae bacterium]
MKQNRREFIKTCGVTSAGVLCGGASLFLNSCGTVNYLSYKENENTLVVSKSNFIKEKYGMLAHKKLPAPIYLAKLDDENYSAVLLECTHKRCEVSPVGDILICPCHGSEYSKTGEVLEAPAEEDLYRFIVTTDADNIYITVN